MEIAFWIFVGVVSIVFIALVINGATALDEAFQQHYETERKWKAFHKSRERQIKVTPEIERTLNAIKKLRGL